MCAPPFFLRRWQWRECIRPPVITEQRKIYLVNNFSPPRPFLFSQVAVTRVRPAPFESPVIIDRFYSTEDLIQTLVTSCHIPFYCAPSCTRCVSVYSSSSSSSSSSTTTSSSSSSSRDVCVCVCARRQRDRQKTDTQGQGQSSWLRR